MDNKKKKIVSRNRNTDSTSEVRCQNHIIHTHTHTHTHTHICSQFLVIRSLRVSLVLIFGL